MAVTSQVSQSSSAERKCSSPATGSVRAAYTVVQHGPDGEYVVMIGRHHDTFVVDDGERHFASRDYGDITHVGDTSMHLRS
ncbi:hypothetical protein GOALK_030_00270 [Gordonia alkanivorans NBRC 16433]|uniref:Uncharacterized protein n=1 Tax=Gordonia alkanivorans NBRC 16433 TaxID=1027371 RepID=F9VS41_9ACTN|nr:hypothetical protein GOALK_030_00270 [Gordonia alkanivorans NBRC 16433]